jgi:BirA family biotin operon repressor/biotin-[acetyl-CoA-carboxylase] ligase
LQSQTDWVSGEALSAGLGVSRVSVWKHIRKLQELGYPITSSSKGYRLNGFLDGLYSWEFPAREADIHYYLQVSSTMDMARTLARKGCPHFTVVIAERQHKGRGRLNRKWVSAAGGLYFTIVTRPQIPVVYSPKLNFCASYVLARVLRRQFDIFAMVKWPNDILVEEKKLAGMLSEMEADSDMVAFINIGLGINVNNDPTLHEPNATSLRKLLGRPVSRKRLLTHFLDDFENQIETSRLDNVIAQWKRYTLTLGRQVRVVTAKKTWEGTAVDVDENGALIIRLMDGTLQPVVYGDCFLTPAHKIE